jgi:hypothetical protein
MTYPGGICGANVVPGAYRGVAVTHAECELDAASLAAHFIGLEAYRRTRFIVVRNGERTAVIAVQKQTDGPLFAPIIAVDLLVGESDCTFLHRPEVDTAVPSALARAALDHAQGKRGVVVQGAYEHVSFIINPAPLRVIVREVVPPYPPKLFDQTRRLLDVAEHLPPIELVAELVELPELARTRPSSDYLLPCRGGTVAVDGANTHYLDERPEHQPWLLIGCERSQQIHEWFYGERADQVDICPRATATAAGPLLTKCCLLERHIEVDGDRVVVPWGTTLAQLSEALDVLAKAWEPTWAPA